MDPNGLIIWCDNQSALALLETGQFNKRSKHYDTMYRWVQQRVSMGHIKFKYVSTAENMADCLTKPMSREKWNVCKIGMGIGSSAGLSGSVIGRRGIIPALRRRRLQSQK